MIGEIWTYSATKPNDGLLKTRPVLVIGNDGNNNLKYVDIHYVIILSSADCGKYDVKLNDTMAKKIGLDRSSIIKTTKVYTGAKSKLINKIGDLPEEVRIDFIEKYKNYQTRLIADFYNR